MGEEMRVPSQRGDHPGDERRDQWNDHRHGALDDVRGDDDVRAARPEDDDLRMIVDDDRDRDLERDGVAGRAHDPVRGTTTGDDVLVAGGDDDRRTRNDGPDDDHPDDALTRDAVRDGDGRTHDVPGPGDVRGSDDLHGSDDLTGANDENARRDPYATGVSTGPGPAVDEDLTGPAHTAQDTPPVTGDDATGVDGGAKPSHAAPADIVLFDRDPAEVQARWRELQAGFVDDPGDAVRRADGLVGEVVEALTSALTSRTGELRQRWSGSGENGNDTDTDTDTEQLRLALREYRTVLERLLALTGDNAGTTTGTTTTGTR
ncbi:hypothetical protein [Nonomuraea roseoviolacea]|uniref:WXG100 family type VII secretion target n=1 Tax=Nonomuraea roseoviolacea subsp. carminata TaxID=160689 RepID=A0ABT1JTB2_9ACTN|nr:hypothetical protein [Nonomuraea roseoviolacea]MCP2344029.1 hypothetical protein [Nonomuraea roseoviolacea subsp. carminata]